MRPPRLPLNWQKIPNSNWSRIFLIILLIRVHSHTNRNHKLPSIYPTLSQHHWSALSTIHFSPPSSFPLSLRMLSRLHLTSSILLRSTPWQPLFSAPLSFSDYELHFTLLPKIYHSTSSQEKLRAQRGTLRALAGICRFHKITLFHREKHHIFEGLFCKEQCYVFVPSRIWQVVVRKTYNRIWLLKFDTAFRKWSYLITSF